MKKNLFIDILKNISAEFTEVFEVLKLSVNASRVNFGVFVDKEISQSGHRGDFFSKIFRYNAICAKDQYRFSIIRGPGKIFVDNSVMTDIKEALNG